MARPKHNQKRDRKHNAFADRLAYLALRVLVVFLFVFSVSACLDFACFLGRLLWLAYHRGRQRALQNLRASFPNKDEKWIYATGRRSFEHIVMLAVDVLFTPRLVKKHNWRNYSRYKGVERVKWLIHEGKGILLIGGHYGNFEIVGYLLGLFGFNIYSIARPLDNAYINNYLYGVRERAGQRIIDKKGAAGRVHELLSEGTTLCFIADQDAGKKGLFVDFFGRKASTYKSIALLAATENVPVAIGYSRRKDNRFFFEIGMNRLILPEEWMDKEDPINWITAEYTKAIEQFVREDPTQYWWLHRRWKHRPKNEEG
jgi:KDO2-lipid IV(A) lauroyltransferase